MIDFLKGTVGKDYFSDRLYGCQECIAEYLASKEPLYTAGIPACEPENVMCFLNIICRPCSGVL